jgi:hypothetical protein
MAVKTDWTAGQTLTAAQTSTYLANSGLVYVTQVTVGSGVTDVSVPGAFSADFDNYVINCSEINGSATCTKMYFRLEAVDGTPSSLSYESNGISTTWGSTTVSGVNDGFWYVLSTDDSHNMSGTFEVLSPFIGVYTWMKSNHAGNTILKYMQGIHRINTSYPRFRLTVNAGTVTGGTITVYGYRKA